LGAEGYRLQEELYRASLVNDCPYGCADCEDCPCDEECEFDEPFEEEFEEEYDCAHCDDYNCLSNPNRLIH